MKAITGFYTKETEKAICIRFDWGYNIYDNVWTPKSLLKIIDKDENGNITFELPIWFINKQNPTNTYSNGNSAWCDVFRKQDQNGLTEYGYAL